MENIIVKLSDDKTAVLRGYISGRDKLAMRETIFSAGDNAENNPAVTQRAFTRLMEALLISYNGKTDNAYEALLDAPSEEFDKVFDAVVEIQAAALGNDKQTKKD